MNKTCLKCGHAHEFAQDLPSNACPSCGAIYAKVEQAQIITTQIQASARSSATDQTSASSPRPTNNRMWIALTCCAALGVATASLGTLYYQELRLNRILLSQRTLPPEVLITNPAPAISSEALVPSGKASVLSTERPPANLAENAEIIVVSGYEAANQASAGTVVRLSVDRPGKAVLLVLSSYEKIAWQVDAGADTQIKGILVSAYEGPSVRTNITSPVFHTELPYSYEKDSGNFDGLLKGLNQLFGTQRVDAFRGEYALPNAIAITELDPPQADLTLQGDQPQAPLKPLQFELTTSDYDKVPWSLEGPVSSAKQPTLATGKAVKGAQDQRIYQIDSHDFQVVDPSTGQKTLLEMPDNFPSLSWPTDVAYDSKRHYVALASLGGEGFLYRFDTTTGKWLDFRSLENVDINSLAYDEQADRYVAWTSDGDLLFIAGDGTPQSTKRLVDRLPGFHRLYDTGNERPPSLLLVPKGDQIALIKLQGHAVDMIWSYDAQLDIVQLTYKRSSALAQQ